jgi:hypothetical protein
MGDANHDHAGDRLGESAPVESVRAETVTVRDLSVPSSYVVYTDGDRWYGLRSATQDVEFTDEDGVAVINAALQGLGTDGTGAGLVHVTADPGGTRLESNRSIVHTVDGTGLVLESGVTFHYTGDREAVILGGDSVYFEFDTVEAPAAAHGIVDIGLRNGFVDGREVRGAAESLWRSPAAERLDVASGDPAGTWVHVDWLDCRDGTERGIDLGSAPGSTIEGYVWHVSVVGPTRTGIRIGDRSDAESVHNHVFYAGVKGAPNDARRLVEFNDSRNGLYLERHTPATGGEWDVVVRAGVEDAFVFPLTGRDDARVKRETNVAADLGKFDPFRHEIMDIALEPDALDGYAVAERGSGDVCLGDGRVVHSTGSAADSTAALSKPITYNYGRLRFDNQAVLRTEVTVADDTGQEATLLWGRRDGPHVGWRIVDDTLDGVVDPGRGGGQGAAQSASLRTGFEPDSSWRLTAFYNPPTDVHFYVDDALAGTIQRALPRGVLGADRVLSVAVSNTEPADKAIAWSTWRNQQYPVDETGGRPRRGRQSDAGDRPSITGNRDVDGERDGAGDTLAMTVDLEPDRDVSVRDAVPAAWSVEPADSPDVDHVEETDDAVYVYLTPDAEGGSRTTYTYRVETPAALAAAGSYDVGPLEARPPGADRWMTVPGTRQTSILEVDGGVGG